MDVNNTGSPAITAANGAKNGHTQPNQSRADDNQEAVVPFQAALESQQPTPQKASTSEPTMDKQANQKPTSADERLTTKAHEPSTGKEKEQAEQAIEQLNYSRHLRNGSEQPALQSQLLAQSDAVEQVWLANLKNAVDQQTLSSATTKFADGQRAALVPFAQKTQPLNDSLVAMATMDEPIDLSAQMQLAGEEESPSLGAFIKNEREPRKDQPLFSLNEGRESLTKNLSSDFMPLNKKLADKEAPSSIVPTFATADNGALIKGAFTPTTGSDAIQMAPSSPTQTVSLTPLPNSSQIISTNVPVIPMQPGVPLGSEAWQQQLNQHMLFFSRQGVSHAQIRLHPEELGSLNVHLRIEDNQAVMHFVSPHSQVRAAMETMMPILRNALQESGIHLAQGSVGQDNFSDQSNADTHSEQGHEKNLYGGQTLSSVTSTEMAAVSPTTSTIRTRGGIDTFA